MLTHHSPGPNHYFYTPCSGIWQSVWIEATPASNYVTHLDLSGDMNGQITVNVHTSNKAAENVQMKISERGHPNSVIATKYFKADGEVILRADKTPHRWSPDSPQLYDVEIKVGQDTVRSYIGFRTLQSRQTDGVYRPMLNGRFIVSFGDRLLQSS